MNPDEARPAAERLSAALEREGFAGHDPWDALTSPFVRTVARGRYGRWAAINALKYSPVDLRRVLGVPRQRHTKALALLVSAYTRLGDTARAEELAADLVERQSPDGGWAYGFDVQTRWGFYAAGQPNAVATVFASHALLDAGIAAPVERAVEWAASALPVERDGKRWFAYYPGATIPVHNASLMVAGLMARTSTLDSIAADAVAFTLDRQHPDGSWPYGDDDRLGWVDGYHTVYVLESLDRWSLLGAAPAVDDAIECGLDLFLTRLVDPDGAARSSLRSRYPVDTHACAIAVTGLCRLAARDPRALPTAERILAWTLANMQRRDGRYAFQRHRLGRNSIPYIRWSDAHMLLALATWLETTDDES
jgi:hypothetical protein